MAADGSTPGFALPQDPVLARRALVHSRRIAQAAAVAGQLSLDLDKELLVDLFSGGGGVSQGTEQALGRPVDIAANHDADACSMHEANHPLTTHYRADVYEIDPYAVTAGRPVGLMHLSPDCTHHSQAKGGQPRSAKIRALTWVGKRWAGTVKPRVITLENVPAIAKWGPLVAKRDPATGRVVRLDGTVAAPGERVPLAEQFLVPDPRRAGRTWRRFKAQLRDLGYDMAEWVLDSSNYGVPQGRKRLYWVARRDGLPIVRPEPHHAVAPTLRRKAPRRTAAHECIDFSLPCPSIFLSKEEGKAVGVRRPLADKSLVRIARGVRDFVVAHPDPFIVPGSETPAGEPLLACPTMVQSAYGEGSPNGARRWGRGASDVRGPMGTIVASSGGGGHALAVAYLMQANGGNYQGSGHDLRSSFSTVTTAGSQQQLVTAHLVTLRHHSTGRSLNDAFPVVAAGGEHHGVVECTLSPWATAGAVRVAAFLMRYYGEGGQWSDLRKPMPTVTTLDRMALITVVLRGTSYVLVDIGMRMLTPPELYRACGFPDDYVIDRGHDGRRFTKRTQVRLCGNSVPPGLHEAVVRANFSHELLLPQAA